MAVTEIIPTIIRGIADEIILPIRTDFNLIEEDTPLQEEPIPATEAVTQETTTPLTDPGLPTDETTEIKVLEWKETNSLRMNSKE